MMTRFLIIFLAVITATAQSQEIYYCMGRQLYANNAAAGVLEILAIHSTRDRTLTPTITIIIHSKKHVFEDAFF